tara:strand:- start:288 stop:878 length:591 start_codon:yes stop_codon:yes gene_type:complete
VIKSHSLYFEQTFEVNLAGQTFSHCEFEQCEFIDCDFSCSQFENCRFIECEFKNCNLAALGLRYTSLEEASFKECKLTSVRFTDVDWPLLASRAPVSFVGCELSHSSFFELSLKALKMRSCFAKDVDFRHADLTSADFTDTDFRDSLFQQTNLSNANFIGASHFTIDITANNISKAKFERYAALDLLAGLDIELVD